jgi:senataxin
MLSDFVEVLRCFNFLLKRLETSLWADETPEYPLLVFDAIKNNFAFGKLMESFSGNKSPDEKPWYLAWVHEYFHCVQKMEQIYSTVVAKISDFLLEELQHERFGDARPHALESAARVSFKSHQFNSQLNNSYQLFSVMFSRARAQSESQSMKALLSVVDIHANIITRVALHRDYDNSQWAKARVALRQFLHDILLLDLEQTSTVITEMCRFMGNVTLKKPLGRVPALSARISLWSKMYQSIHRQDPDGLSTILQLVSEASHIDTLNKKTFEIILSLDNVGEAYANGGAIITAVNNTLSLMRTGFLNGVRTIVDYSTSSQLSVVLERPQVSKAAMLLLLSPVDDLQTTAKILIAQAFDVDGRLECIRALLEKSPDSAIDGLLDFLNKFCAYAPNVPEACSLSKSLVRCFTDVIDVLCSNPEGLVRSPQFLRCDDAHGPGSRMIELWTLMSKSIAVIFKRTPAWSTYFESAEMIEWMRDALIFGRDMLAQWQVIEGAANAFYQQQRKQNQGKANVTLRSLSEIGQKMISCFQDVLTELTRWLRLTDEELLHQSFSLLQSLLELFRKTEIRPCDAAFQKLTRYAESARKDVDKTRSRLDASRISSLEEALSSFNDDDDEIQIISEKIASKSSVSVKREKMLTDKTTVSRKPPTLERGERDARLSILDRASTKSTSSFFTDKDKERLERSVPPAPTFKRQDKTTSSVPQNQRPGPSQTDLKERYKNEASSSAGSDNSSDSDSSESDNEAPAGGLARLAKKFSKSPKIKKPAERRQIKIFNIAVAENVTITRMQQREEAHRARMRMKPDISGLHRVLLSWSYDHDGPTPPGFSEKLKPVPDTFHNFDEFYSVFQPLFLLECWAQIVQAKDETPEIHECKISGKQYSDCWLDLDVVFEANLRKDYYLAETDVVLFRHPQTNKSILAKAKSFTSNYQVTQASLRCFSKHGGEDPGLLLGTSWKINKVFR